MYHSNTSHVIVYPIVPASVHSAMTDSNTSHVIVYPIRPPARYCWGQIQIHLMLLFIRPWSASKPSVANSNTSHVIVYLGGAFHT